MIDEIEVRPKYLIKVHRNWKYGPRARFWDIEQWREVDDHPSGGYWSSACRGGLAYTEWGMWRAINKRLKKMKFGHQTNYYTLDRKPISYPHCKDADKDTCYPNDPECLWRTITCPNCKKDYKISKRGLAGKYMIADHDKVCKKKGKK